MGLKHWHGRKDRRRERALIEWELRDIWPLGQIRRLFPPSPPSTPYEKKDDRNDRADA